MGMVSGYLPGNVSFYPSTGGRGTSADYSRSMDSRDRAGTDTLVATSRAVTKDRHLLLRTTPVVHHLRPHTAPRDKTRNTAAITSTAAITNTTAASNSNSNLPTAGPHKTQTTTPSSNNSTRHHHSSPTAARTNTSTVPRPQSQAHTDSSLHTSSTDSIRRADSQERSRAGRHQGTYRSRREATTLGEPMRGGCLADSRVERNMMGGIRVSSRADTGSTRRRRREGILHRLVGVVISLREGISHHRSIEGSIGGSRGKGRSGRY